jgi:hypothetical protein
MALLSAADEFIQVSEINSISRLLVLHRAQHELELSCQTHSHGEASYDGIVLIGNLLEKEFDVGWLDPAGSREKNQGKHIR